MALWGPSLSSGLESNSLKHGTIMSCDLGPGLGHAHFDEGGLPYAHGG